MTKHQQSPFIQQEEALSVSGRRRFMNSAALAGLATAVVCTDKGTPAAAPAAFASAPAAMAVGEHVIAGSHPKPGELDTCYGLWDDGHTGDMCAMGMPSGREIHRIPMSVPDALVGWGITNESKRVMGMKPGGILKCTVGDIYHVYASYRDGNYNSCYAWISDKVNSHLGCMRLDYSICDKVTKLPNVQDFRGIFPDKRDPLEPKINYTTRMFCGGEFVIPLSNTVGIDNPSKYRSLFMCVDVETMEVCWQVLIDGNCDLVATSYDGKLAATNQYNTEMGVHYEDTMSAEHDVCLFFNVVCIEAAVRAGELKTIGDSKVPVVDGAHAVNQDPKTTLIAYMPVSKNLHGVNASPDQKHFICTGKLLPTGTVIELSCVLDWFNGKLVKIDGAIAVEVELGPGSLHIAFDGRSNAYTMPFLDSQIVKWNTDAAIKSHNGDKNAKYVVDRPNVHYQLGYLGASQSEIMAADSKFLAVGCKSSRDRLLSVGPLHPENEQLIDISGDKIVLLQDHPTHSEPHDFIILKHELLHLKQIYSLDDFPLTTKDPKQPGVVRNGKKVTVWFTSQAPAYSLREFKLKKGDEVTLILTNLDKVEDLTHGSAILKYNINFTVDPQETVLVTFIADKSGVFQYYYTHSCHVLHLEMRSRMIVEA